MGTTGTVNGTIIAIYVGGTKIDLQLSAELSISHEPRTSINKDSAGWEGSRSGKKSWEMNGESEFAFDSSQGFDELFTAMISGTQVALKFSSEVSTDSYYYGNAQVTKLDSSPGVEEDTKYSYAFKGNGALGKATV